jgi:small nuclear ribonucleoprotein (snRNP)-like protein
MKEDEMMKGRVIYSVGVAFVMLWVALLALPTAVEAKAEVKSLKGMNYLVNASLKENLKPLEGKSVNVTLASGSTFTGTVKAVGNHFLHLKKIQGRDFYDALIRIKDISAIDAKFRDFKR